MGMFDDLIPQAPAQPASGTRVSTADQLARDKLALELRRAELARATGPARQVLAREVAASEASVNSGDPWINGRKRGDPLPSVVMGGTAKTAQAGPAAALSFDDLIPADQPPAAGKSGQGMAGGVLHGVWQGVRDPFDNAAMWVRGKLPEPVGRALDAADRAIGNSIPGLQVAPVRDTVSRVRNEYEAARRDQGRSGVDLARAAGNVVATAPVGGMLAKTVGAVAPVLGATKTGANLLRAIETGGMAGGNLATRAAGGAITGGATGGLISPDSAGESAAIGAAMPGLLGALGRAAAPVANLVKPAEQTMPLARKAIETYGIPLGIADITGSGATKAVRSVLNDAPFIGNISANQRAATQAAFNRSVGRTFGADVEKLTPDVVDAAKSDIGKSLERLWGSNVVNVDNQFMTEIEALRKQASIMPSNEGGSLTRTIDDLLSKAGTNADGTMFIPGDAANKFQSALRRRAEGSPGMRHELADLRKSVIGAFNRSVRAEDAEGLRHSMGQYKALKTVEPLLNSAEVGVAGRASGDVPAALLPAAVMRGYGNAAGTQLGDLAAIGSHFLADRVARTGGSTRALIQNGAIGGAIGTGSYFNPLAAAVGIPSAMGLNYALGAPGLAKRALNSDVGLLGELLRGSAYRSAPVLPGLLSQD